MLRLPLRLRRRRGWPSNASSTRAWPTYVRRPVPSSSVGSKRSVSGASLEIFTARTPSSQSSTPSWTVSYVRTCAEIHPLLSPRALHFIIRSHSIPGNRSPSQSRCNATARGTVFPEGAPSAGDPSQSEMARSLLLPPPHRLVRSLRYAVIPSPRPGRSSLRSSHPRPHFHLLRVRPNRLALRIVRTPRWTVATRRSG